MSREAAVCKLHLLYLHAGTYRDNLLLLLQNEMKYTINTAQVLFKTNRTFYLKLCVCVIVPLQQNEDSHLKAPSV